MSLSGGSVLVVDDEAVNRLLLVRSLEQEGLQTATAADCLEAHDMLRRRPFDPSLLRARINAGLAKKRLLDLQREYLDQVDQLVDAAVAVEAERFDPASLETVSRRPDALGQLARVFCRMARNVRDREKRLRQQVRELAIEIDHSRSAPGGRDHRVGVLPEPGTAGRRAADPAVDDRLRRMTDAE